MYYIYREKKENHFTHWQWATNETSLGFRLKHNSLERTKGRLTIHIMCLFCGRNDSSFIIARCAPMKMNGTRSVVGPKVIITTSAISVGPCELCVCSHSTEPIIKFYAFYWFSRMRWWIFCTVPSIPQSLSIHITCIDGGQIQMSILLYTSPIHRPNYVDANNAID